MEAPVTFKGRLQRSLDDRSVAENVANVSRKVVAGYANARANYPFMEKMRDRGREIRLHTLANLDTYLEEFTTAAEANGTIVFFAADAAEANRYVTDLAARENIELVVKGKSMVTEETELNDELIAEGIEVVETDLGEFIAQLDGEKPSHIIAPILHKSRQDVGRVMADKLGIEYTDDPEELVAVARGYLRQRFLRAGMGITGCNLAVADSGAIALVENEGNGRMSTTSPRIHVVFMGMERIVPTFGDLTVLLNLLARAGTGQSLSVYTNLVTGPRRPGEPDGPEQLHVVVVDNGRSSMLGGDLAEILACIRCGACLNICPVYREIGGHAYGSVYSGPVGSVVTPGLWGLDPWHELPQASTLCGACRDACPVRIDIPRMLVRLREESARRNLGPRWLSWGIRRFTRAATDPKRWSRAERLAARLGRLGAKRGWITKVPGPGSGWTDHRDLPVPDPRPFRVRWAERSDDET